MATTRRLRDLPANRTPDTARQRVHRGGATVAENGRARVLRSEEDLYEVALLD
jgi:hypothetical protein